MNKFSSIFGEDSTDIFEEGILPGSDGDEGGKRSKRVYLLAAVCSNALLPIRTGSIITGN